MVMEKIKMYLNVLILIEGILLGAGITLNIIRRVILRGGRKLNASLGDFPHD